MSVDKNVHAESTNIMLWKWKCTIKKKINTAIFVTQIVNFRESLGSYKINKIKTYMKKKKLQLENKENMPNNIDIKIHV